MQPLNLRKIKVLVMVAETRSATLAGQRLHLGQSAISQTLKELQEDLGIALFERVGRGLIPTAAGLRLAEEGQQVLAALTRADTVARALQNHGYDSLAIGVMTAFIHGAIARCIADFSAEHKQLSVMLESRSKQQLIEQVVQGSLDIAVVIGGVTTPGLHTFATIAMRVVCITPLQHPLASQSCLHEKDLHQYRQIRLIAGSPLRVALEAAGIAQDKGEQQRALIETSTQRSIVTMVEAGAGIALVDPLVLSPEDKVKVLIFEPAVHVNLSIFARSGWQKRPYMRELAERLYASLSPLGSTSHFHETTGDL